MIETIPAKWKASINNITIYIEYGPHGGLILSRSNGEKTFQFAESKSATIRAFGEMFLEIADWADRQKGGTGTIDENDTIK